MLLTYLVTEIEEQESMTPQNLPHGSQKNLSEYFFYRMLPII